MARLTSAQQRWLVRNAVLGTALINASINAGIAWMFARRQATVPMWRLSLSGKPSTLTDTVGTLFFLPVITTVVFTSAVWRDLRSGRLEPLTASSLALMGRLKGGRIRRGLTLGVVCTVAGSPVAAAILVWSGFGRVSAAGFVAYKTALAVALGAVVTPLVAIRAMTDRFTTEPK